jgi:FkbM family methyltransferase
MLFFSQQGEDLYVLKNYINKKNPSGIFVEVGALDGIAYSNTGFLEMELGFSGVLIEPSKSYEKLLKYRPGCTCVNNAISDKYETVLFRDDWAMSGILTKLPDDHKREKRHEAINDEYYEVDTVPLGYVLSETNIKYIDFLSIDVEGSELEVLRSMNWDIPVYVICIEMDGHNPEKDEACREILQTNGFTFDKRLTINEFWVNKNYHRTMELFDPENPYIEWDSFKHVKDLGDFILLEPNVVDEVQRAILG